MKAFNISQPFFPVKHKLFYIKSNITICALNTAK